jgi:hypothetical protein
MRRLTCAADSQHQQISIGILLHFISMKKLKGIRKLVKWWKGVGVALVRITMKAAVTECMMLRIQLRSGVQPMGAICMGSRIKVVVSRTTRSATVFIKDMMIHGDASGQENCTTGSGNANSQWTGKAIAVVR